MATKKPVVVIVGAGFGGMNAAKALRNAPVEVVLLDQNNYHLFQPLLYQVATAGLSPTEIAYPVRAIFRKQKNFDFRLAEVTCIDFAARQVLTTTGPVDYDYLILGIGSENNFFGLESVEKNAIGLKDLDDSIGIRNHIIRMFERADQMEDREMCRALRTFVVVGGGPTGVEMAGSLSELIRLVLIKDYPDLSFDDVSVQLLEMTGQLLAGFPENLQKEAAETLREKHVQVRFHAAVSDFDGQVITLKDGEQIQAATLIWAAGVKAAGLLGRLGLQQSRQDRVVVTPTLQLPDHPEVFVVGDAAYLETEDRMPLPMVAPVAIQQGKLAAGNIQRMLEGRTLEPFVYKDPGSLATIGRNAAVARVGRFKFHGFPAWLVWLAVHLFWLIGYRNRLIVLINWAYDYIFYERGIRLITPDGDPRTKDRPWPVDLDRLPVDQGAAAQHVGYEKVDC